MPEEVTVEYDFDIDVGDHDKQSTWVRPDRPWEKFRPEGVPRTVNYPIIPLHALLKRTALHFPNNVGVFFVRRKEKYMYREMDYLSDKCARALADLGLKKGDGIAIMTPNCPEYLFSISAISQNGGVAIPINPLMQKNDVLHVVNDFGNISTVIVHESLRKIITRVEKVHGNFPNVVVIPEKKEVTSPDHDFHELVESAPRKPPKVNINPKEDTAAILYTGGTTGLPKGVVLTHFNFTSNAFQAISTSGSGEDAGELLMRMGTGSSIAYMPLCHGFGFFVANACILAAVMLILYDRFSPSEILKMIELYRCEGISGVPPAFQMMINHPDWKTRDLSSLLMVGCGGAALPDNLAKAIKARTDLDVVNAYGLTESSCLATVTPRYAEVRGISIGFPAIDTDAKVVDLIDYSKELEPGEAGELLLRGPQMFKEYWNKPEATALVKFDDGFIRTGDVAKFDEDGYIYIVGRSKEMIKYKGYRVLPADVENSLYNHPSVLECGVIGVPDELAGETIKAFIRLKPEYKGKITEQEIIDWAKENIAAYKYPRRVEFIGFIPKSKVGKVFRRGLREIEKRKHGTA